MFGICNCHSLRQATRRVTQLYDRALAPLGLRATQYSLLVEIERMAPVAMIPLADALVMDRATLGHNLRPLETRGLLTMEVGEDRRSREVSLTKAGKKLLADAEPLWRRAQAVFEKEIGSKDSAAMRAVLHKVSAAEFAYT